MRVLLPVCAWSGISIAFYSGVLVSILSHQQHGDHHSQYKESMFAMVALGIGQILGSFYTGFIVDKCGSRIAAQQNCLNLALALVSVAFYLS